MAERLSALARLPVRADDSARARLSEVRPAALLQIQAWPDTLATVDAVVIQTLRIDDPPKIGRASWFHNGSICAVGPGRYVISTTDPGIIASFRTAFASQYGTVADISHGRTILRLEGIAAAQILSRCAPLDFDPSVFPADRVAQTAVHHVDVLIHRLTETSFEIWVLRSFAEALVEWMIDAGAESGIAFGGELSSW